MPSSSRSAFSYADTPNCEASEHTGCEIGDVWVYVRRIRAFGVDAAHHYIVVNVDCKDKFAVYEWMEVGLFKYATSKIRGKSCLYLGRFTLDQVNNAADNAVMGKEYGIRNFNCNMWTEATARRLGKRIKVHYNCANITNFHSRECQIGGGVSSLTKALFVLLMVPIFLRGIIVRGIRDVASDENDLIVCKKDMPARLQFQ